MLRIGCKPEELALVQDYLASFREKKTPAAVEFTAWKSFCKTLMASNEFHFID